MTIYYSFQNWNLARPEERSFAGFDNYIAVVTGGLFLPSLWATVWIVGLSMILSMLLGLFFAMLLDRKFPGRSLARTLLITPFLIMPAAAALLWKYSILDTDSGIVTLVLSWFGLDGIAWTTDHPGLSIVFTLTWQYTPFMMLILLAGLQSQSGDILEAADVDGSNALQTFRYMTLPHLRTYAELAALLGTVLMVQVFDPVNIMTKGAGGTKTLPYLLYERAFIGQQIGEAAAYGVITVVVTIVLATAGTANCVQGLHRGGEGLMASTPNATATPTTSATGSLAPGPADPASSPGARSSATWSRRSPGCWCSSSSSRCCGCSSTASRRKRWRRSFPRRSSSNRPSTATPRCSVATWASTC